MSVVYACEHSRLYLFDRKFTLFLDHKAIVNLLNKPKSKFPLRIERMTLRLQGFNFDLKHIRGGINFCDYSSRYPFQNLQESSQLQNYINFIAEYVIPNALDLKTIKEEMLRDPIITKLAELVRQNT